MLTGLVILLINGPKQQKKEPVPITAAGIVENTRSRAGLASVRKEENQDESLEKRRYSHI